MLLKRVGRVDAAMHDFRSVVQLNPKNLDALRELRLWEMRRPKHQPSKTPSKPVTKPPSKMPPRGSSKPPSKPPSGGGVLAGLGKLFKR
jgi:hypothetical protein